MVFCYHDMKFGVLDNNSIDFKNYTIITKLKTDKETFSAKMRRQITRVTFGWGIGGSLPVSLAAITYQERDPIWTNSPSLCIFVVSVCLPSPSHHSTYIYVCWLSLFGCMCSYLTIVITTVKSNVSTQTGIIQNNPHVTFVNLSCGCPRYRQKFDRRVLQLVFTYSKLMQGKVRWIRT